MGTLQERLARGDPAAFAELYDAWADRLCHYLVVRLGSRADADDALQETFLRLARNRRKLASADSRTAYVFTVARNEAARLGRRRARHRRAEEPLTADALFVCQPTGESAEEVAREAAEIVATALGQLSAELREVVELKFFGGLTFQQIGQVTGLPQGTVATRYRAALAKMQGWLARQSS
jgi:RNA polymerase sigma-70 factor (ECF subfamily)